MTLHDFNLVHCPWGISSHFKNIHLNVNIFNRCCKLVVIFLGCWIFWKHWHDKVNLWQSRNALYSDFPHPPVKFPKTKLSLENIPTQGKKKWSGQMQDKYNNRWPMSGTWNTLGTLKPAYYNIFFIYYSHECVTATGSVNCHNFILAHWHQQQIPEFLCWKFL